MRNVIRCFLVGGCFSVAIAACGTEDGVLSPEVRSSSDVSMLISTTDPSGDAAPGHGIALTEAYQDIVGAAVDATGGVFTFTMDVAANLPTEPTLPGGITLMTWSWNLNTIPTASPRGYPFAPGLTAPPEFQVWVFWNGTEFGGTLIDRRPLLGGDEAGITSIAIDIDGATLSATVDASLLDNPSSILWIARTTNWHLLGTQGLVEMDRAPDLTPVTWP
jgi:hypothetical protein